MHSQFMEQSNTSHRSSGPDLASCNFSFGLETFIIPLKNLKKYSQATKLRKHGLGLLRLFRFIPDI